MNLIPVTFFVSAYFARPEIPVAGRQCRSLAIGVPVPKATVHKDCGLVTWKYNIGFTWKSLGVETKPKPPQMKE